MTDRDALLAAIRAAPDDDAPRLVYADWLDERGEHAHAEFVRCAIAFESVPDPSLKRKQLKEHLRLLRRRVLPMLVGSEVSAVTRRGFVNSIQAGLIDLSREIDALAPHLVNAAVLIDGNRQNDREAEPGQIDAALHTLMSHVAMTHLREFEVHALRFDVDRVRALFEPGHLANLTQLVFGGGLDDGAVEALMRTDKRPGLRTLAIHELPDRDERLLTGTATRHLAAGPLLRQLDYLSLMGNWLDADGLVHLAGCDNLAGLRRLGLWTQQPVRDPLARFITSPHLAKLEDLDLSWMRLPDRLLITFANPTVLPGLKKLAVRCPDGDLRLELRTRFGKGLEVDEE